MLELTRRMTPARASIDRIAGAYFDEEGYVDGTFNTHFLKLSASEGAKNLELAKTVLISKTNEQLREYQIPEEKRKPGSIWQLFDGIRETGLKDDAFPDLFYELLGEKYKPGYPYACFLFHGRYDVPVKGTDKAWQEGSEEVYEYLICAVSPLEGEYEPGVPESGFLYPLFGICLIIMAVGVIIGIFTHSEYTIPEIWSHFGNMHPDGKPIWSFMFITVACGAISGFHSTQSPLMARCMKSEKQGHFVFYGAMVAEGVIALIWAAAGCSIYEVTGGLNTGLAEILSGGQSAAIYDVCIKTMGSVGVALAMIGVIVCPITSGDTAFRSARLVLADWFKIDQDKIQKRLLLCVPLLAVGAFVGHLDYAVVWRYFSWTNQTLAMIVLWTASMYLFREKKNYWITAVPATFMSAVSMTYFFCADECLGFSTAVAYPVGIILAVVFLGTFIHATKKPAKM